jgi:hypothetical protein
MAVNFENYAVSSQLSHYGSITGIQFASCFHTHMHSCQLEVQVSHPFATTSSSTLTFSGSSSCISSSLSIASTIKRLKPS